MLRVLATARKGLCCRETRVSGHPRVFLLLLLEVTAASIKKCLIAEDRRLQLPAAHSVFCNADPVPSGTVLLLQQNRHSVERSWGGISTS